MLFLSSFINFCLVGNLLWSFLCFYFILAFWPFPWQRQPFLKSLPLKAQLHMAYGIPTRFHKVWSRHLREMCRTIFWRKKERKKNNNNNLNCHCKAIADITPPHGSQFKKPWRLSIRKSKIYLETKFCRNWRIFVKWPP
jgi:hypothetical protein